MSNKTSFSMTPPLSPTLLDIGELPDDDIMMIQEFPEDIRSTSTITCFMCTGEVEFNRVKFHANSFIKSGYLKKFLKDKNNIVNEWNVPLIDLFGFQFIPQITLLDNMEELFMFAKMCINNIHEVSKRSGLNSLDKKNSQLLEERKNLCAFFQYIVSFLKRYLPAEDNTSTHAFVTALIDNLHSLLLYSGVISDLPLSTVRNISQYGHQFHNQFNQQYHSYLDIYWYVVEIVNIIFQYHPDFQYSKHFMVDINKENNVLYEIIFIILSDLINLAVHRKNLIKADEASPFPCYCCMELWVMLMHTVQKLHAEDNQESFMVRIHIILQSIGGSDASCTSQDDELEIDSDKFTNQVEKPDNNLSFTLWLIVNISRLYSIDINGEPKVIEKCHNHYFMIESVLKKILAKENLSDIELRCHLRLCLSVCQIWQPNTSLIVILWDYFFRRLNSNFQLLSSGVRGLATVSRSPLALLEKCRKYKNANDEKDQETSFDLFLKILSTNLSRFVKSGSMQEWRQMRGRFYSKFHQRRLQELTDIGLENFTSLFLTLCVTVELEDVAVKLVDFYKLLDLSTCSPGKRAAIMKGCLALIHIYIDRTINTSLIADKLFSYFDIICRHWKILGHNEIIELLEEFGKIVVNLRVELSYMKVEGQLYSKSYTQFKELAECLWQMVYPFVKEHSSTLTPPTILADLAASFTLLSQDIPPSFVTEDKFINQVKYFTLSENVNINVSCRYLCQVLNESGTLESILSESPSSVLIQAWLRCFILLPSTTPELQQISSVMLEVNDIKMLLLASPSADILPNLFIKSLGHQYLTTDGLKDKMVLREKVMCYFSLIPNHITPVLKAMGPNIMLNTIYHSVGYIIKHCAPLLFLQSDPNCPLPAILSVMITPHYILNTNKPVNSTFLAVLNKTLHMFIMGLSKLDFRRAPYVERRLKDIVSIYLEKFPMKSSTAESVHPLIGCVMKSFCNRPTPQAINFRHFILEIVHDKYLKLINLTLPPSANVGLSYVTEVLQKTMSGDVIARDSKILLQTMMEYVLISSSPLIKEHSKNIMQFLLEACSNSTVALSIEANVKTFIEKYINIYFDKVFTILEAIGVLYKDVIINIIPYCTSVVIDLETKRGVGVDSKIRKTYYSLLKSVGDVGLSEIQRLQAS